MERDCFPVLAKFTSTSQMESELQYLIKHYVHFYFTNGIRTAIFNKTLCFPSMTAWARSSAEC